MSPTLEGFRAIFRRPSLVFAEIAWRWSFGVTFWALAIVSFFEYLDTLPISQSDLLLLRSRQPALVFRALQHTLSGSALRVVEGFVVFSLALVVGWVVLSAIGRAATLRALLGYFRANQTDGEEPDETHEDQPRLRSLLTLSIFRVAATLAAALGCIAAFILANLTTSEHHPEPALAAIVTFTVVMLVCVLWSGMNWYLSLAAVFVVAKAQDTFSALAAAVDLCRERTGSVFAAGTWFGLAHLSAFVIATTVVAVPLGLASVAPGRVVLLGVLLVTLAYFAVADFLYMARLAAYVAILELPEAPPRVAMPTLGVPPDSTQSPPATTPLIETIDRDELILSDVPQN